MRNRDRKAFNLCVCVCVSPEVVDLFKASFDSCAVKTRRQPNIYTVNDVGARIWFMTLLCLQAFAKLDSIRFDSIFSAQNLACWPQIESCEMAVSCVFEWRSNRMKST